MPNHRNDKPAPSDLSDSTHPPAYTPQHLHRPIPTVTKVSIRLPSGMYATGKPGSSQKDTKVLYNRVHGARGIRDVQCVCSNRLHVQVQCKGYASLSAATTKPRRSHTKGLTNEYAPAMYSIRLQPPSWQTADKQVRPRDRYPQARDFRLHTEQDELSGLDIAKHSRQLSRLRESEPSILADRSKRAQQATGTTRKLWSMQHV